MIVDAHVHLFPDRLAEAIRRWFGEHAWEIRYRLGVDEAVRTLREGGIDRFVVLPYAHKTGMAAALNDFTLQLARAYPEVVPCCTAFPGEEGIESGHGRAGRLRGAARRVPEPVSGHHDGDHRVLPRSAGPGHPAAQGGPDPVRHRLPEPSLWMGPGAAGGARAGAASLRRGADPLRKCHPPLRSPVE